MIALSLIAPKLPPLNIIHQPCPDHLLGRATALSLSLSKESTSDTRRQSRQLRATVPARGPRQLCCLVRFLSFRRGAIPIATLFAWPTRGWGPHRLARWAQEALWEGGRALHGYTLATMQPHTCAKIPEHLSALHLSGGVLDG